MKAKLITAIFLAAPLVVNSAILFENLDLAKKSHQLAMTINQIANSEGNSFCKDKVEKAAAFTEMAAEHFMSKSTSTAKIIIGLAIQALGYSAVEDCQQANAISLAKIEAQKIHDAA